MSKIFVVLKKAPQRYVNIRQNFGKDIPSRAQADQLGAETAIAIGLWRVCCVAFSLCEAVKADDKGRFAEGC